MTPQSLEHRVAANVDAAIKAAGENPHSVALATGIPRVTLLRRLDGTVPFNTRELGRIAAHFNVPVVELIEERDA